MLKKVVFAAVLALSFLGSVRIAGSGGQVSVTLPDQANACWDPLDCLGGKGGGGGLR
jgi:hypothetical protein